jgi:hypothetical protein
MNFDQFVNSQQTTFKTSKNDILLVGMNALSNRFYSVNGLIPFEWFNESLIKIQTELQNETFNTPYKNICSSIKSLTTKHDSHVPI